jgi:ferredoxin
MITINYRSCTSCAACIDLCPVIAISLIDDVVRINNEICTECETCIKVCPMKAPYKVDQ